MQAALGEKHQIDGQPIAITGYIGQFLLRISGWRHAKPNDIHPGMLQNEMAMLNSVTGFTSGNQS